MRKYAVATTSGTYEITVGVDILSEVGAVMKALEPDAVLMLVDRTVGDLYGDDIRVVIGDSARVVWIDLDVGETSKSLGVAAAVLERMAQERFRRSDAVVTLGGGVVSDLGGFVASVYARGIRVVHIPTTLLGQVDAAIGGKTGVNLTGAKNLVGTFHQPTAVIVDTRMLTSLPEDQWRSGMAEVVKYALCFRPEMIASLGDAFGKRDDVGFVEEMVSNCVEIKASVVSLDERDQGGRLTLNYGHTLGHALESASGYSMTHGDAISVGMVFAARLSVAHGVAQHDLVPLHVQTLASLGLPVDCSFDAAAVTKAWSLDKKNVKVQRWVLLTSLGHAEVREDVPRELAEEVLRTMQTP